MNFKTLEFSNTGISTEECESDDYEPCAKQNIKFTLQHVTFMNVFGEINVMSEEKNGDPINIFANMGGI
jgi:hypothetical protein